MKTNIHLQNAKDKKDEEFNKILKSLPLDKILMNKIIKTLFE